MSKCRYLEAFRLKQFVKALRKKMVAFGTWHTDGGTSLLHAGLTIFGTRQLEVDHDDGCISLKQKPGSFYIGNMVAMSHAVHHDEDTTGCFTHTSETDGDVSGLAETAAWRITATIRTDVFREARARTINSTLAPKEVFDIVNEIMAILLKEVPLYLPTLSEVLAEEIGFVDPLGDDLSGESEVLDLLA